ncbi:hypothetical protein GCM10023194_68790 [Planotetraspora phitsanulokensis]|uniref:Right handed beta helix domain-containing protein n=1 Tax=Planotetraspora phitsanulokensis TaxID=575192 RepID=A0A8J3XKH6_9ACTN|nr:hypothetical protein [Planotetraspora phitsanulokensis]GII39558.1 hypothetical protein Pph01_45610 [Planotetraspora phitsanulokensis]
MSAHHSSGLRRTRQDGAAGAVCGVALAITALLLSGCTASTAASGGAASGAGDAVAEEVPQAQPAPTPRVTPSSKPASPQLAAKLTHKSTPIARSTATAPRPASGFPTAATTGVPNGTALKVVNGDQVFSRTGQIVVGMDFHGFVKVAGRNVTFRNCVFRGRATGRNAALLDAENGIGTVVEDSEFVPSNPSATIDGIWARDTKIYRANIHGSVDGIKAYSDTLVQDSYIHDMRSFSSDPNQGGGPTHNDGVQSFGDVARVTLRHNTIDMSTSKDANAAYQSSARDSLIENNSLDGGGCTLNFSHKDAGTSISGIRVVGNRFGRHSFYQCPILLSTKSFLSQNSGNVWDTGAAIPPPQRHD